MPKPCHWRVASTGHPGGSLPAHRPLYPKTTSGRVRAPLGFSNRSGMHDPRAILITGASGGIGGALARGYAASGVRLALTGRNAERLQACAEACRAAGAEVRSAVLDVVDTQALASWVESIDRACPLDLVIANA